MRKCECFKNYKNWEIGSQASNRRRFNDHNVGQVPEMGVT